MSTAVPARIYTVEYQGAPATFSGAGRGDNSSARRVGSARRRVDLRAASEAQAMHRAAQRVPDGRDFSVVGRAL